MQIVMAAAGHGSRFAGYTNVPKPFIRINGIPMWQYAAKPWLKHGDLTVVFNVLHREHFEEPDFPCKVIWIEQFTRGAAETAYIGTQHLNETEPVCFVDSDGMIEFDSWDYNVGGTFVVPGNSPQHSFVRVEDDRIVEIAEKQVISDLVNTGHYWWASVGQFRQVFEHAEQQDLRVRGEFYMAPMYALAMNMGHEFKIQRANAWHCWGTPQDLERYLNENNITPR